MKMIKIKADEITVPTSEIIPQETATSIREKADSKSSMDAIAFETWNEQTNSI